jgi:threonine dehydratase
MRRLLAAGKVVETEGVDTVADGLAVRSPAPEALIMLKGRYDAVVAVSDADIIRAMGVAAERLGLIVEPAGAAGLAAILADAAAFTDQRTATVTTGGNISLKDLSKDNRHGLGCSRPCHLKSLMLVRNPLTLHRIRRR